MNKFRIILAVISGLIFIRLLFGLTIAGSLEDIVGVVIILFFGLNTFYIVFSIPNFKASDALDSAATKLAIITLEMKYRAGEAKVKEDIEERLRQERLQKKSDKKLAAKDFLNFARSHPMLSRKYDLAVSDLARIPPPDNQIVSEKPSDKTRLTSMNQVKTNIP